jgi:hypothetical protein
MDLENFENDIFWKIFNTNLDKIVERIIFFNLKIFLKIFKKYILRIFPKKKSPKGVPMALISSFTPTHIYLYGY